ncbi:MAG: DeoR/GlpR family DNA-binding transcription regulator [Spirochaetaceae bacterium]|nr:DeoR/GlpR family DNA-binding transcription regulator [Spirochaetaceae bacterium]
MKDIAEKIVDILRRKGYRSVVDLASELRVSDMTVRRHLERLAAEGGQVRRVFGGAFLGDEMTEVDYRVRDSVGLAEKRAIGRAAYAMIQPGESIFIDAGTTAAQLALAVDDTKRISVVTNSLVVMQSLEQKANVETFVLGGRLHAPTASLVGYMAVEAASQFRFAKAFLGTNGIDGAGLTQANIDEVPIKKVVAANAKEVIVLADSRKFDSDRLFFFLAIEQVHTLVTDPGIPEKYLKEFAERGVRIVIAEPEDDDSGNREDR